MGEVTNGAPASTKGARSTPVAYTMVQVFAMRVMVPAVVALVVTVVAAPLVRAVTDALTSATANVWPFSLEQSQSTARAFTDVISVQRR